jgi:hypothetical protein
MMEAGPLADHLSHPGHQHDGAGHQFFGRYSAGYLGSEATRKSVGRHLGIHGLLPNRPKDAPMVRILGNDTCKRLRRPYLMLHCLYCASYTSSTVTHRAGFASARTAGRWPVWI